MFRSKPSGDAAGGARKSVAFELSQDLLKRGEGVSKSGLQQLALVTRRYMHEYGATSEQFARVSVTQRSNASRNPRAFFRDPITVEDVLASRYIADPLHLLDCSLETDGACAVVVTSADRAKDLK